MSRRIRDVLREADGDEMCAREIALAIMAREGLDVEDKKRVAEMAKRVGTALRRLREGEDVVSRPGMGSMVLWRVR